MSIIFASTEISVLRPVTQDRLAASYASEIPPRTVARGVRANIGSPTGVADSTGGDQETITVRMQSDPVDMEPMDQVRDDRTGLIYDVVWAVQRAAFPGREHTQSVLTRSRGAA